MILRTPRLHLRALELADAPFILALLNEPSFLQHIGDKGVRDLDQARAYLQGGPLASYAAHGHGLLGVAGPEGPELIGMCGLLKRDTLPEPDLGYAFLPAHWGRGYAAEAATAVRDHGHHHFGFQRLLALVSPDNAASLRLLGKLGFHPEGLRRMPGEDEDVALYAWTAP